MQQCALYALLMFTILFYRRVKFACFFYLIDFEHNSPPIREWISVWEHSSPWCLENASFPEAVRYQTAARHSCQTTKPHPTNDTSVLLRAGCTGWICWTVPDLFAVYLLMKWSHTGFEPTKSSGDINMEAESSPGSHDLFCSLNTLSFSSVIGVVSYYHLSLAASGIILDFTPLALLERSSAVRNVYVLQPTADNIIWECCKSKNSHLKKDDFRKKAHPYKYYKK